MKMEAAKATAKTIAALQEMLPVIPTIRGRAPKRKEGREDLAELPSSYPP